MKLYKIQEVYPGLIARYDVCVVAAPNVDEAKAIAAEVNKQLINTNECNILVSEATPADAVAFVNKVKADIRRSNVMATLIQHLEKGAALMF